MGFIRSTFFFDAWQICRTLHGKIVFENWLWFLPGMELLLYSNNVHDLWKDGLDAVTLLWIVPYIRRCFHKLISGWWNYSLRKETDFPPVAFAPPKNTVCETEPKNDFLDVTGFVSTATNKKSQNYWKVIHTRTSLDKGWEKLRKQIVHRDALSTLWGPCFGV